MNIEDRLQELEGRVAHLHSTFNAETDAMEGDIKSVEEDVETLSNSIDILVHAMNKIASAVTEMQTFVFQDDDEDEHISITSPVCTFAVTSKDEIHKSYT